MRNGQGAAKRDAFADLVRLLAVHESAEEQVVHPRVRKAAADGADRIVQARLDEEHEAKQVLSRLYDLGVDHPDFDGQFHPFAEAVLAHATHEETDEFPRLRETLPPERLRRMAGAVKAAESLAPTRPHPMAGESRAGNLLAGPPMAIFDRARDRMREWRQANPDH
ncbi:hemerythrin domain-containing protein [Rugosimonospora acidiphila]|uniref:Hemerythrin domain-containing protein n=1 Tax=Rugosimonospora acidiphila TaxID=556531 RepID=A0ABP9SHI7_9ACTN